MNLQTPFGNLTTMNANAGSNGSNGTNGASSTNGATTVNIQRTTDPFARYKMPKMETSNKSKGQYAETYLTNLEAVAEALKVSPRWIVRFMAHDLNSPMQKQTGRWMIKGLFDQRALEESLRSFIDKYVSCPKCDLPELQYLLEGKGKKARVLFKCKSCGWNASYDPTKDRIHKVMLASLV